MRGRSEHHGRIFRTDYCKQTGSFVVEEERHPFLLRLAETHAIANGIAPPAPVALPLPFDAHDCSEKGKLK